MKKVWKVGPTARSIYSTLSQVLRVVENSPDVYLNEEFLSYVHVRKEDWDLTDTDEFFACMKAEEFVNLKPSKPYTVVVPYEDIEYPDSDPPYNVFGFEECAYKIETFFEELQTGKFSSDGYGITWPTSSSIWIPREKYKWEEELHVGNRMLPSVPFTLERPYYNGDKPHQVYYAWHGDEGRNGVIQRSELQILIRCMKGRIADRKLCMHTIPVRFSQFTFIFVLKQLTLYEILLLSIHGAKARIMIAHFNLDTHTVDVKCSKFEQFDGFEAKEGTESKDGRARPQDFEAKRDLFVRWLNPICQGKTYLEDTKDGQELVLRGPKGRKRLVPRTLPRQSSSTESSETHE